jgi:polyketide cyclase/dehydrase/lipid transport protein
MSSLARIGDDDRRRHLPSPRERGTFPRVMTRTKGIAMSTLHTAAEAVIDAPASTVLEVLRDFDGRHRAILPPAFSNLVIEAGGIGAGTVMSFDLKLGGRTQRSRSRVEEPAPGIIEEHIVGREMVTSFTVRPEGDRARTRIETRWQPGTGLVGMIERLVAPRMLRQLYRDELARLNDVASAGDALAGTSTVTR